MYSKVGVEVYKKPPHRWTKQEHEDARWHAAYFWAKSEAEAQQIEEARRG